MPLNYALALALSAAGWSNSETARRLNKHAAKLGYTGIAVDHTRVGRWLRCGEKPRPPVHQLLADLLSEHLGQPCTPQSLQLTRCPVLRVPLQPREHAALLQQSKASNLPPEEYAGQLLRSALALASAPSDGKPRSKALA
ncbi:hypothetical protein ABT112_21755 [Streptomyces sp. NPDC002055]|uniref:hypothetical protein n=1 Tax=Streptomyces sp. NPDC002055 TaxID=3154534 RepID=UPI0033277A53